MNEKAFKAAYVVTFLASLAAKNYADDCMTERRTDLNQPVEDAMCCADGAWVDFVKVGGDLCQK